MNKKEKFFSELVTALINCGVIVWSASFVGGLVSLQFTTGNPWAGMVVGLAAILVGAYMKSWEKTDGQ